MSSDNHGRLLALDGMRGLAALAVMLFHAHPLLGRQVAPGGYLAVDLFFVLSGCVIAHAYENRLLSGMPFSRFMARRLIRFYPFYLAGLAAGCVLELALWATHSDWALTPRGFILAVACGALFIPLAPIQGGGTLFPLNVPSWSLFYELVVNALYAATIRFARTRVLLAICAVSLVAIIIGAYRTGSMGFGPSISEAPLAAFRTLFSFSAGVLIFRHRQSFQLTPWVPIVVASALFFIPVDDTWRWLFDVFVVAAVFPTVLVLLVASPSCRSDRIFSSLGEMSYGLYALHYPAIWFAAATFRKLGVESQLAAWMVLAALTVACVLIERYIEVPVRSALTAVIFGRSTKAKVPAGATPETMPLRTT